MRTRGFSGNIDFVLAQRLELESNRAESFFISSLNNLEQGAGRLNFVFDQESRKSLRFGFDRILDCVLWDESREIKFRRKSNFQIIEIPDKPMSPTKEQQGQVASKKMDIPKLDIRKIRCRSSSESRVFEDSETSIVKGKDIMSKLQRIQQLVKEAKQELEYKNQQEETSHNMQRTYRPKRLENSFFDPRHLPRNQSYVRNLGHNLTAVKSNSKMTCSYISKPRMEQSQYIVTANQKQCQQKRQKKSKLTSGEKMLLMQFKQIKGYFKELIGYNKRVLDTLERDRDRQQTFRTQQSELPSYFHFDATHGSQKRISTQPSQSYHPVNERGARHFNHTRTKTQIPAHNCGAYGCCYENTFR